MGELLAIENGNFKFVFGDFKICRDLLRFFIGPVFGSTFWALFSNSSFDPYKIPLERRPPTHRLLDARFLGELKQLQNRDFSTSNRSKPIRVLTRTKCSCSDDRLPISFLLSNFQPNRRNFLYLLPLFTINLTGVDPNGAATLASGCRRLTFVESIVDYLSLRW